MSDVLDDLCNAIGCEPEDLEAHVTFEVKSTSGKSRRTSLSKPKTPDPTVDILEDQIRMAVKEEAPCNVRYTIYSATARGKDPRKIIVLSDGKSLVTLATAYNGKSAGCETTVFEGEESFTKATQAAFFRLNRSGYTKANTEVEKGDFYDARELWKKVFEGQFGDHKAAKAQFLRLVGAQDNDSLIKKQVKKAQEADAAQEQIERAHRYSGNGTFGLF